MDIELEHENGLDKINEIKQYFDGPIIFVSCINETEKIVEGFNKGADDYITKPFDLNELYLRIERSITRDKTYRLINIDCYKIDEVKKIVYMNEEQLDLSEIASQILIFLLKNKGQVVTREQIFKEVWEAEYDFSTRVIDTHISYIRRVTNDVRIKSIRSKGYKFEL